MGFELRLLDRPSYDRVVAVLANSTEDLLGELVAECMDNLNNSEFRLYNSVELAGYWQKKCGEVRCSTSRIAPDDEFVDIAIALLAMPQYQDTQYGVSLLSENLVYLGEDDGGLYGVLLNSSVWFEENFHWGVERKRVDYGVGEAMYIFADDDLVELLNAARMVDELSDLELSRARHPIVCRESAGRLTRLLGVALASSDSAVAACLLG